MKSLTTLLKMSSLSSTLLGAVTAKSLAQSGMSSPRTFLPLRTSLLPRWTLLPTKLNLSMYLDFQLLSSTPRTTRRTPLLTMVKEPRMLLSLGLRQRSRKLPLNYNIMLTFHFKTSVEDSKKVLDGGEL